MSVGFGDRAKGLNSDSMPIEHFTGISASSLGLSGDLDRVFMRGQKPDFRAEVGFLLE